MNTKHIDKKALLSTRCIAVMFSVLTPTSVDYKESKSC